MARREAPWTALFSAVCIAALLAAPGVEAIFCLDAIKALPRCFRDSWKNLLHKFKWNDADSWFGLVGGVGYFDESCCVAYYSQANGDCIVALGMSTWTIKGFHKALKTCKKKVGYH
ncbi:hypothetical protein SLEP1_g42621 [Rubroshorea leprosula]|uniref:Uncharacterized protein n=1 Tax=Rubroshorea leprosula TaxID=152421 RepID=A0AAV5LAW6_9ROSI|nr:hypothetical protein SLEP1_g42621 [Rubroshorea leprosula]